MADVGESPFDHMKGPQSQRGGLRCQSRDMLFSVWNHATTALWRPACHGLSARKTVDSAESVKRTDGLYARAVPGMHRGRVRGSAGAVSTTDGLRVTGPTATGASIQISGGGKGLKPFSFGVDHLRTAGSCVLNSYPVRALLRPYGFKAVIANTYQRRARPRIEFEHSALSALLKWSTPKFYYHVPIISCNESRTSPQRTDNSRGTHSVSDRASSGFICLHRTRWPRSQGHASQLAQRQRGHRQDSGEVRRLRIGLRAHVRNTRVDCTLVCSTSATPTEPHPGYCL